MADTGSLRDETSSSSHSSRAHGPAGGGGELLPATSCWSGASDIKDLVFSTNLVSNIMGLVLWGSNSLINSGVNVLQDRD